MNPGFSGYCDDVRIGPTGISKATVTFKNDGRLYQDPQNGSTSYGANWYTPTTGGAGSSYSVRFVKSQGDTPGGITLGAWIALSGEPAPYLSTGTSGVSLSCELWAYIALTADTSVVLATGFVTLSCEKT
jgi:hypothetical protein